MHVSQDFKDAVPVTKNGTPITSQLFYPCAKSVRLVIYSLQKISVLVNSAGDLIFLC